MNRLIKISWAFAIAIIAFTCVSCIDEDEFENSPKGNFEALWKIMDEHYCFFDYKKSQLGVDWDEIHERYAAKISESMSKVQLFEVCCEMLSELKDGHVNLRASHDLGRNWSFMEDYPDNFDENLLEHQYLGTDYSIASGLKYRIFDDNIGYMRCESFSDGIGDGNISDALYIMSICSGLIIDVRDNEGGNLTTAHKLVSHFINEETLVGYISHKTGKGRNDFSDLKEVTIDPADGVRWQKPIAVLCNRTTFSAANEFVKCMKTLPNVTVVGDSTGGGSGMPFTLEIPSGWSVRYSAVVIYDKDKQQTEFGVAPDIKVGMKEEDADKGLDTIIETAKALLQSEEN